LRRLNTRLDDRLRDVFEHLLAGLGQRNVGVRGDEDYAVIVLDQPIGLTYGWLASRTYDNGWDDATTYWRSIGYPQDWSGSGEIAAWQTDFKLNELDSASG
jgi:hypothetical protein